MAGSFWLSWLLLTPVSALPWLGPQETFSATATADWSPVPTNAEHELFKRGLYPVNLCGWQVPQDLNYLEKANSIAGKVQATKTVIGCCSISGSCDAVYTSCIDGKHPPQSVSYPGVLTCTSTSVCYLNKFPKGYSQYGCGTTSVGETVVTSYSDSNTQLSVAIVYTGGVLEKEVPVILISSTAAAASPSTSETTRTTAILPVLSNSAVISGSTFSATPSSTSSFSLAPSPIPTTPTSETRSKELSTGAKIAIGVVAIIAVVLIILYYYFRRPKQARTSHRHPFPNITGDGEGIEYVPPFKGSENNPVKSYRSYQPQAKDIQYIPVAAPPYQTTELTPFQSTTNTATVPTSPSRSPTRSAPTPTMTPIPDVFELPTKDSAVPAITGASLPELDNPDIQNREMDFSHRESSITMAEGNLARLNREMEQVRAEKEMAIRLQQLERREAELKEQILREQERLINE
ncbi:hypothetical protein L207DRAFT_590185 [Hyaloscypha variabilis F]|uniref:Mid2 domain-containing protein n=1 Tax=Hyaloscypha variabilis (strain UAMH 11265 / GT02V1 / F) TaxID=1149755 RepID=A0A2J6R3M7_HYAVF|nr:hypothetical protein L207DRAFT_590185 [Hyaloscypha variabilis F]